MKKTLSLLLALCLLLGLLPAQALAYAGDIQPADSGAVRQSTLSSGSLALQNDYLRVIARKDGTLSTAPAADSGDPTDRQTPFCEFVTYGYYGSYTAHPASLRLKSLKFVDQTPNGQTKAIRAEYDLTVDLGSLTVSGETSVYYEIVQLKEDSSSDTWGVLVSVDNIKLNENDGDKFHQTLSGDLGVFWGYTLDGFTGMGHRNAADSPVIKMNHTVYDTETKTVLSAENSVITGKVENISTWESFSQGGDWCSDYITEVYTDGYAWANPFVGLSEYYKKSPIQSYLPDTVSVTPASRPGDTRVECINDIGYYLSDSSLYPNPQRFLWGFRNLVAGEEQVPTAPDAVDPTIYAKRLAAFAVSGGVTVEYVADDAALEALKKQYGSPVALISGNYESKNGAEFTFTGGAALLAPSVAATWGTGGKLVIHKDGRVEQQGVSLNAPSFKFYQPKTGAESELKISLTADGFDFAIDPDKNDAILFVDIPYATVKLEQATADAAGNLVFSGEIGFQTVFEGASFTLEELGYGLNDKNEFTVNGVHAKGSFDTAKTLSLELAKVEGEVNTFKGKEKYAFTLELNAFDLFETEAELELVRSKKDGSLLPNTLYFYVAANPGIPLIPPIPIGQLNGGGAGFSNLADTVNGDYFAIPPLKLRGTLKGTYLHLIEGKGDVVLGPSEISLKASDVGIVGTNASIINSFGYTLKLNGQERSYRGQTYKGIYFAGSEELELNLPSTKVDVIVLKSAIELGAFGGVDEGKNTLYLGVGANGIVEGTVKVPKDVPIVGGLRLLNTKVNLVVGGQTTAPIRGVSVSEGMKQAFKNIDIYIGAMANIDVKIVDVRAWVLVPQIVETDFRRGEGWDVEHRWFHSLPEWDWSEKGIDPVVQSLPDEESIAVQLAADPLVLENGKRSADILVDPVADETPYIVLAFDSSVTEEQIKENLSVNKGNDAVEIHWIANGEDIDPEADINATIVGDMKKTVDDGKVYRMAILRLKEGGNYSVNAGELTFSDEKSFAVEPFESLSLTQSGASISGQVEHPAQETAYVLRTYLANAEGGADYLVDEQTVTDPEHISVSIPTEGALAPTGEYFVTSFLMTEREADLDDDGELEKALVAIDSQAFRDTISYTNTNQPDAPENATLEFAGNEVMTASWDAVNDADGYRVTVYQQDGNDWVDTGFGYDLDKDTTVLNMALTVGGEETEESQNLSAKETYQIGVSAYRTVEGGKYYGEETLSNEEYLPEYEPLKITLAVNSEPCTKDENGVFHVCVGGQQLPMLQPSCTTEGVTYRVTRMDLDTDNEIAVGGNEGEYLIPEFSGTLMLRVDGQKGKDVTSVFLLVSHDETAPVLTLSDPIFYADRETGEYTITGTADAGSKVFYSKNEFVYAAEDGSFAVSGTLEDDTDSDVLSLYAQDSVWNTSAPQLALVARQGEKHSVTVNGSYAKDPGAGNYAENSTVTVRAGSRSGYTFDGWTSNDGITFADAGAEETTFIMPGKNVTVTANWARSGGSSGSNAKATYPVRTPDQTENGSVTVSPKNASKGDTVTITVKPDSGYVLETVTATDKNGSELPLTDKGDGKYTFTMPAGPVEVKATFMEDNSLLNFFYDVPTDAYYYEAVKWAAENGITGGIGNNLFGPEQPCTRAQIVTFLWRAAGSPEPKALSAFTDVPADSYYAKAVAWAVENGITTGTGDGKFSPDATCTRAQSVTFLFRAAKASADGAPAFTDVAANAYYAEAVKWATDSGITNGIGGGLFGSDDDCTRAQIVTFLFRAYNQ